MDKVNTGISGFSEISNGGLGRRRGYLLKGDTGTGKSIFGMQFLYYGAIEYGESGLYVSTKEFEEIINENYLGFGWDLRKLEAEGKLFILDSRRIGKNIDAEVWTPDGKEIDSVLIEISRIVRQNKIKRLVLDSLYGDCSEIILKLKNLVFERELTAIFIKGKCSGEEGLCDGVIKLEKDGNERIIEIEKLTGCRYILDKKKFRITSDGINILEK